MRAVMPRANCCRRSPHGVRATLPTSAFCHHQCSRHTQSLPECVDVIVAGLAGDCVKRHGEVTHVLDKAWLQSHGHRTRCVELDPCMVQRLLGTTTIQGRIREQAADQILGMLRDVLPMLVLKGVSAGSDPCDDVSAREAKEWWLAAEHHVHHDADTPKVAQVVVTAIHDLWSCIRVRANHCAEDLIGRKLAGEAEVDNLQASVFDGTFR
mmetsp:Transcript_82120/g.238101  ORF Transcript_82120/g.238101 Transcript_82120/m.238101 type:complete len:210 (+) Transcript_82120:393-1022(+)